MDDKVKRSRLPRFDPQMRTLVNPHDEQINRALPDVLKYLVVRIFHLDKSSRMAKLLYLLRHNCFQCATELILEILQSVRMVNNPFLNYIEHIHVGSEYLRK